MRRMMALVAALAAVLVMPSLAEGLDVPALVDPEARYEMYTEETDGSEDVIYMLLDSVNDEAETIEEHGALWVTDNQVLSKSGIPHVIIQETLQDSSYGTMFIVYMQDGDGEYTAYTVGDTTIVQMDGETASVEMFSQENYLYYCESSHFPYDYLDALNGVRQDENGNSYFLFRSDEDNTFEFAVNGEMWIEQLRWYTRNSEGKLQLYSYADYAYGDPVEVPEEVMAAFAEALG